MDAYLLLYNDVVDGNMNQFDKETNESHDSEANSCGKGNLLELWK